MPEELNHYLLIFLLPGFIGILTYNSFDWISVLSNDKEHCLVQSGGMTERAPNSNAKEALAFSAQFLHEDKVTCERVQKGMGCNHHKSFKLLDVEWIMVGFRQYLAECFFPSPLTHLWNLKGYRKRWSDKKDL